MQDSSQSKKISINQLIFVCLFVLILAASSLAQSTNIENPTPVVANEISGVILARDIGDPRLTRHYYVLTGTPGDLVISVESLNLNGDVDLFTVGNLRPLTKLSIFSGLSTTSTTNSVYLRRRESLILRIEARSASDEPGTYRVRFSGGFEPMAENTTNAQNPEPTVADARKVGEKTRRVNSAGARINEPLPEIASGTRPLETVTPATVEPEKTEIETSSPVEPTPAKARPSRPVRTAKAKPPVRTTRRRTTTTAKKKVEPPPSVKTATSPAPPTAPPPATAEPVLNPRLIIETRDGVRVERYMSEVRRVSVERGQLIVVTIDGRIERRPMTSVLRVVIEP